MRPLSAHSLSVGIFEILGEALVLLVREGDSEIVLTAVVVT